jgi:hypothetical protein
VGLGIPAAKVTELLRLYTEELTQDMYSPSRAAASRRKRESDLKYLDKLEKMTVKTPMPDLRKTGTQKKARSK